MVVLATITEGREMVLEVDLEKEVDPNFIKSHFQKVQCKLQIPNKDFKDRCYESHE